MGFGRSAPARRSTSTSGSCFPTTCKSDWRSSKFAVKKNVPPGTRLRRTACGPLFKPVAGYCREGDADLPGRWRRDQERGFETVRIGEPRSPVMIRRGERGIWQRRYWEHTISDDWDLAAHLDCISFQSGEARFGRASGRVAAFLPSSLCCRRAVPGRLDAQRRRRVSGNESKRPKRRRQNVSFQTMIVGHSRIRRQPLTGEGAALFRPTLAPTFNAGVPAAP
jgi:hypothetical protein